MKRTRCEVWTRVMGYFRPLRDMNAGKRAEEAGRRRLRPPPYARRDTGRLVAASDRTDN